MSQQVTTLEQGTVAAPDAGPGLRRPEHAVPLPTAPIRVCAPEPAEDGEWNAHAHCRIAARFLM
ncbi:hypothetical protein ABH931_005060 [Streptacidiphilus sp. MAP12-33]|uniref:hypothetical protein n=1 Tax=Streptacidiphilus sp. MAP12-33 TaxID=3156266 RepID=UPI00351284DE